VLVVNVVEEATNAVLGDGPDLLREPAVMFAAHSVLVLASGVVRGTLPAVDRDKEGWRVVVPGRFIVFNIRGLRIGRVVRIQHGNVAAAEDNLALRVGLDSLQINRVARACRLEDGEIAFWLFDALWRSCTDGSCGL